MKMLREQLMAAWADLVAAGKDKPTAAVVTKVVGLSSRSRIWEAASRFEM